MEQKTKSKIIFVDDEQYVLDGLRRMLRTMSKDWDMAFATSGPEALKILDTEDFDVIVTDMRMPEMDGAQLLAEVNERHPDMVRIVLSGHSDEATIFRSLKLVHRCLAKPCDPEMLRSVVKRSCELHKLLASEQLQELASRLPGLPSVPALYLELVEALKSPNTSVKQVGEIISKDIAMTAKMLQLVNSAFFGLPRNISDPAAAASLIGLDNILALVLSVKLFTQHEGARVPGISIEDIWRHSMRTAGCAKAIARVERVSSSETDGAFFAAMLHDCGKILLINSLPTEYREALALAERDRTSLVEAERRVLGVTHSAVGAYLLGLWGLPDTIVEVVAYHHSPSMTAIDKFSILTAVHVANALEASESNPASKTLKERFDLDHLRTVASKEQLSAWNEACKAFLSQE